MHPHLDLFGVDVPTYFLVISLASVLASLWFIRRAEKRGFRRVVAIDLTLVTLAGGFLGARLLHVFYEDFPLYRAHPAAVFAVWNGGFVYLGGVVGAWLAAMAYCNRAREPFWYWADVAAPAVSLGYALGRLACFFNGCCYGRYCEQPWAVTFADGIPRHPTQIYATTWELTVLAALLVAERQENGRISGMVFNLWLFLHCIGRIFMEMFRDDYRGPLIGQMSLGVWMSLGLGLFAAYNMVSTLHRLRAK